MSNLRQVTLHMWMLADDNDQRALMQVAKSKSGQSLAPYPGTYPPVADNEAEELWKLYLVIHPYLKDPRTLVCPDAPAFRNAEAQARCQIANTNPLAYYSTSSNAFSYFLAVDAKMDPASTIVAGDSHLASNPVGTDKALAEVELKGEKRMGADTSLVTDLKWTSGRHAGKGVMAFGDGHAEVLTSARLRTLWADPTNSGVRIWLPN